MVNTNRVLKLFTAALILAAIAAFLGVGFPASAQSQEAQPSGPTTADCYSARFHAASDCDRLSTQLVAVPVTGDGGTTRYYAASDGDRFPSQQVAGLQTEAGSEELLRQKCFPSNYYPAADGDRYPCNYQPPTAP